MESWREVMMKAESWLHLPPEVLPQEETGG
jgi:hypothetical protein